MHLSTSHTKTLDVTIKTPSISFTTERDILRILMHHAALSLRRLKESSGEGLITANEATALALASFIETP